MFFEKIDTVVEVAKSVQDNGGGSDLDSILNNADKADDLKVLVDKAVESVVQTVVLQPCLPMFWIMQRRQRNLVKLYHLHR